MADSNGFDFCIGDDGELILEDLTYEPKEVSGDDNRLQLAISRIRSVSSNWFYDNVGADLEVVIGQPCSLGTAKEGKRLITHVLTYDQLWSSDEFTISSNVQPLKKTITYEVYFKLYVDGQTLPTCYTVNVTLDLVRGVNIHYGWETRKG